MVGSQGREGGRNGVLSEPRSCSRGRALGSRSQEVGFSRLASFQSRSFFSLDNLTDPQDIRVTRRHDAIVAGPMLCCRYPRDVVAQRPIVHMNAFVREPLTDLSRGMADVTQLEDHLAVFNDLFEQRFYRKQGRIGGMLSQPRFQVHIAVFTHAKLSVN